MTQKINELLNFAKNRETNVPDNLHIGWITNEANEIVILWAMKHEAPTLFLYDVFHPKKIEGFNPDSVSPDRLELAVSEYLKTHHPTEFSIYQMCRHQFEDE